MKEESWNQEVDKEAIRRRRGLEKTPVKSLCVAANVCVCAYWLQVCEMYLYVCTGMRQLQGTSVAHNKAIHLVHDSLNRQAPLMLHCSTRCIMVREILNNNLKKSPGINAASDSPLSDSYQHGEALFFEFK